MEYCIEAALVVGGFGLALAVGRSHLLTVTQGSTFAQGMRACVPLYCAPLIAGSQLDAYCTYNEAYAHCVAARTEADVAAAHVGGAAAHVVLSRGRGRVVPFHSHSV